MIPIFCWLLLIHVILSGICAFIGMIICDCGSKNKYTPRFHWTLLIFPHFFLCYFFLSLLLYPLEILARFPAILLNGICHGIIEGRHWEFPELYASRYFDQFRKFFFVMPEPRILEDQF